MKVKGTRFEEVGVLGVRAEERLMEETLAKASEIKEAG